MGFSGQEHWSGSPFPPPGDLPDSGTEPASPGSPAFAGGSFTTVLRGSPVNKTSLLSRALTFTVDLDDALC